MKKKRRPQRSDLDLYYDRLFREHGANMFCPVCDARPCIPGCWIGLDTEDELIKLTAGLAQNDVPRKKRRRE